MTFWIIVGIVFVFGGALVVAGEASQKTKDREAAERRHNELLKTLKAKQEDKK